MPYILLFWLILPGAAPEAVVRGVPVATLDACEARIVEMHRQHVRDKRANELEPLFGAVCIPRDKFRGHIPEKKR